MAFGRLVLRTTVGGIILGHGLQKLNGSFGGPGLEGTEKMMGSLGLHPAKHQAWAVALSETVGGGLTAAGFLSPLGPAMIIGSQAVAMQKVHLKNGFWLHNRGYEYNLLLMAGAFALAGSGPGALSLDGLFGKRRSGTGWALLATALASAAASATLSLSERFAPKEDWAGSDGSSEPSSSTSETSASSGAGSSFGEPASGDGGEGADRASTEA